MTDHSVSLVSLLIAAVVAGVGFLQWRTARLQWLAAHNRQAFDLFDKRYEIYRVFRGAVGKVMAGSGRLPLELSVKIREASEESRFLFGDDVVKYLSRFIEDLDSLDARVAELEESRGQERKTNIDQQRYFRDRIEQFRTEGVSLFAQYIRFDQKIKTTYFGR